LTVHKPSIKYLIMMFPVNVIQLEY